MKLTLDASIHLAALNPHDSDSDVCRELLERLHGDSGSAEVVSPTLLIVEVSTCVARAHGDPAQASAVYQALRGLARLTMIPLSELLAEETSRLAAQHALSSTAAVYGAVAQLYGTTLVTLDAALRQDLEGVVDVLGPAEILRQLSADASS